MGIHKGGVSSWPFCLHLLPHSLPSPFHNIRKMLGIPSPVLAFSTALFALGTAQTGAGTAYKGEELLIRDPGVYGPALEVVHLYWDQFPTGIAVSKNGRRFSNYPGALDPNNTYRGTEPKYTIAELLPNNTERAFPSAEMNMPVSRFWNGFGVRNLLTFAVVCYAFTFTFTSSTSLSLAMKNELRQTHSETAVS
jgi:hypothetical protein